MASQQQTLDGILTALSDLRQQNAQLSQKVHKCPCSSRFHSLTVNAARNTSNVHTSSAPQHQSQSRCNPRRRRLVLATKPIVDKHPLNDPLRRPLLLTPRQQRLPTHTFPTTKAPQQQQQYRLRSLAADIQQVHFTCESECQPLGVYFAGGQERRGCSWNEGEGEF